MQSPLIHHTPRLMTPYHFVDDLIPHVLEANDHQWWPGDFYWLALVSTGWVGPVRRRLYSCPVIRSFKACRLLERTLRENAHIRMLMQGIDLQPMSSAERAGSCTEKEMASLRYMLNLGGLKFVILGGELSVNAERFLHMMTNTKDIVSLHISGSLQECSESRTTFARYPSLEWDEVIAFKFPRLRVLRLSNLSLSIIPPSLSYPLTITDLTLDDIDISEGFLPHLCHDSWDTVRRLSVVTKASITSEEQLRWMMECCANLQVLHYELRGVVPNHTIFDEEMPTLRSLLRLRLGHVNLNPQCLFQIGQTCLDLVELTVLGRAVQLTPGDWVDFIHSGALPSLKMLHTTPGTNEPPFCFWDQPKIQSIVDVCRARQIAFVHR